LQVLVITNIFFELIFLLTLLLLASYIFFHLNQGRRGPYEELHIVNRKKRVVIKLVCYFAGKVLVKHLERLVESFAGCQVFIYVGIKLAVHQEQNLT
jgi:hypothetical protein